jgi:hypothetical protein
MCSCIFQTKSARVFSTEIDHPAFFMTRALFRITFVLHPGLSGCTVWGVNRYLDSWLLRPEFPCFRLTFWRCQAGATDE